MNKKELAYIVYGYIRYKLNRNKVYFHRESPIQLGKA